MEIWFCHNLFHLSNIYTIWELISNVGTDQFNTEQFFDEVRKLHHSMDDVEVPSQIKYQFDIVFKWNAGYQEIIIYFDGMISFIRTYEYICYFTVFHYLFANGIDSSDTLKLWNEGYLQLLNNNEERATAECVAEAIQIVNENIRAHLLNSVGYQRMFMDCQMASLPWF